MKVCREISRQLRLTNAVRCGIIKAVEGGSLYDENADTTR